MYPYICYDQIIIQSLLDSIKSHNNRHSSIIWQVHAVISLVESYGKI